MQVNDHHPQATLSGSHPFWPPSCEIAKKKEADEKKAKLEKDIKNIERRGSESKSQSESDQEAV